VQTSKLFLDTAKRGFVENRREKIKKGEARDLVGRQYSGEGDASSSGCSGDGGGGRRAGGPGGEVGEAAAGAALGGGTARGGVWLRAVAGAEGRRLLRLRVPPVARRLRRRRTPAGGVGEDHLPFFAQAGEDGRRCDLVSRAHRSIGWWLSCRFSARRCGSVRYTCDFEECLGDLRLGCAEMGLTHGTSIVM
jgi:hypothetical protein